MTPSQHDRVAEIVAGALARPPAERDAFINRASGDDAPVAAEARSLVAAAARAGGFLDRPTVSDAASASGMRGPGALADGRAAAMSEAPGSYVGRYKLLQQIGEGGFGVVFLAEQREPVQRLVALKIIKLGMDTRAVVARFEAERQALAMMDHPGIARVLDAGATGSGRPYFVMELVRGEPIDRYCDHMRLDTRARLELFAQVCQAVQHAHTKGVIHRDIKPGNVLVTLVDGRPLPKVIDFGIAKATGARLTEKTLFTEFRQMIGTPAYMSPEQAGPSGVDIDTRSDVYSLGVLLYELLTGVTPFDPQTLRSAAWGEMQRIIREDEPPKPSTRLSTLKDQLPSVAAQRQTEPARLTALIRGDLDWIVMRCLEKDRARRYETASGLASDVLRHLAGEPVTAAPPSSLYRFRKFIRRHRTAAAAVGLVATALLMGMTGTAIGLVQARSERDRAIEAERRETSLREQAERAEQSERTQRAAAQSSEATAKTEAARSEQITQFLSDMLRGVQPAVAQGRDTSVIREIVDKTIARLDAGELKDQPEVEARLRNTIGLVLNDLGQTKRAIEMQRDALRLMTSAHQESSLDAALIMNDLGATLSDDDQHEEAAKLLRRALEIRRAQLGPDDSSVGTTTNNLAMQLLAMNDLAGAETMLREGLAIRRRALGSEHAEVASSLSNIAMVLYEKGEYDAAEPFAREALAIDRKVSGNFHPDLIAPLNNLAWIQQDRGELAETESLFREALAIAQRVYDPGHIHIGSAGENLALCLQRRGKHAEAIQFFTEALDIAKAKAPAGDVRTQRVQGELVVSLLHESRFEEARATAAECLALRKRLFPDGHGLSWTRFEAMTQLSQALVSLGRFAEAAPLAVESAEWMIARAGTARPKNPDIAARVKGSIDQVIQLYEAWEVAEPGHHYGDQAAEWKRRLETGP